MRFVSATHLWHSASPKYAPQHCNGFANDHFIRYVLQLVGGLSCHQGNEYWGFVQVPEQEQLSASDRGAPHVAEQVRVRIPEHSVKAQHNLIKKKLHYEQNRNKDKCVNCCIV